MYLCTFQMTCTSKTAGRRVKRIEICESGVLVKVYMGYLDFVVFNVIFRVIQ